MMLEVLRKSGYVAPPGQALAEEKLRRMLRRFELDAADAEVFLGMMRKIAWKVGDTRSETMLRAGSLPVDGRSADSTLDVGFVKCQLVKRRG